MQSNEDLIDVNRQIAGRNYGVPFGDAIQERDYLKIPSILRESKAADRRRNENIRSHCEVLFPTTESVENPQLTTYKDRLAILLDKRERIKDMPDSPGFDMGQRRRGNELQINEVREEIKRLEDEQSNRLTQL